MTKWRNEKMELSERMKVRKIRFLGKEISSCLAIVSGVVITEMPTLKKFIEEFPWIGVFETKSFGLLPKAGNDEPIIAQYYDDPFSFINAEGLTNPGAEEAARGLSEIEVPPDKALIISIFGDSKEEFRKVARKLHPFGDAIELNLSCPHSDKYGKVIGQNKELVKEIVKSVASFGKPVFVKISPNLDIVGIVKSAIEGGASGITAINTRGPESYSYKGHVVLSNRVGGVSGREIKKLGVECVRTVRSIADLSITIIGCGGVGLANDVWDYKKAGADIVGLGSRAFARKSTKEAGDYVCQLVTDLEEGTNKAQAFFKRKPRDHIEKYWVAENKQLDEDLFLIKLNKGIKVEPGQFIFAWLPGKGKKPFSVFDDNPLTLLVKKRGAFTEELSKVKRGQVIYIWGPYGNSPGVKGKILLVGGGTGIAGLPLFAKRNKEVVGLFGAKNKKQLPNRKEIKRFSDKTYFTTENGKIGHKGLVTDILEEVIEKEQPDFCLNCGPEAMVRTAIQIESRYINPENIRSSIDFLTRCGIGLCGSCVTDDGKRSCVDGTWF